MDIHLTFANGSMTGEGTDDVGRFLFKGRYDSVSRECYWTKSYFGRHDVFYRGFREGKGIWGTWEITIQFHGGFHIWPASAGEGVEHEESATQTEPVDAIGRQEVSSAPVKELGALILSETLSSPRCAVAASDKGCDKGFDKGLGRTIAH
jgi:hypothetical protein